MRRMTHLGLAVLALCALGTAACDQQDGSRSTAAPATSATASAHAGAPTAAPGKAKTSAPDATLPPLAGCDSPLVSAASRYLTTQDIDAVVGHGAHFALLSCGPGLDGYHSVMLSYGDDTNGVPVSPVTLEFNKGPNAAQQWDDHVQGLKNSGDAYQHLIDNAIPVVADLPKVDAATYSPGVRFDACTGYGVLSQTQYFSLEAGRSFNQTTTVKTDPVIQKLVHVIVARM